MEPLEATLSVDYVQVRDGEYFVGPSRVSLAPVVCLFLDGQAAEAIGQSFPVLSLEQVYGAVAYYPAHREEIDAHLRQHRTEYEEARRRSRESDPMFYQKLADARRQVQTPSQ